MDSSGWNAHYRDRDRPATAEPHARLWPEIDDLAPGRALDLACGFGRNSVWLAEQGWKVTGVDFSEVALGGARELAHARGVTADWIAADLLDYQPQPGAYDLVLVFFLHLPPEPRDLVLGRAAAAVAPGGVLLVAAHDRRNHAEGVKGPKDPAVLYSPDDIVPLLDRMTIERAEQIARPVETPTGGGLMIDAVVRARRPSPREAAGGSP